MDKQNDIIIRVAFLLFCGACMGYLFLATLPQDPQLLANGSLSIWQILFGEGLILCVALGSVGGAIHALFIELPDLWKQQRAEALRELQRKQAETDRLEQESFARQRKTYEELQQRKQQDEERQKLARQAEETRRMGQARIEAERQVWRALPREQKLKRIPALLNNLRKAQDSLSRARNYFERQHLAGMSIELDDASAMLSLVAADRKKVETFDSDFPDLAKEISTWNLVLTGLRYRYDVLRNHQQPRQMAYPPMPSVIYTIPFDQMIPRNPGAGGHGD